MTRPLLVALSLFLAGCASNPAPTEPAEPAWTRVARESGVPRMTMVITQEEVDRQSALGGKVGFEAALSAAITSLCTDDADLESPVSIFRQGGEGMTLEAAQAHVKGLLNRPETTLELVLLDPPYDESQPAYYRHHPHGEEDPKQAWIFFLDLPETQTAHWAVVPRDGSPASNYGFD